ncbi:amidase [Nesterenkonia lutea]|uniref:Asp-tRNA(Asn)/Glu-tRNA(Gln) amidotransferase A subunit family amidase n=1 Tax=Nesterenkonia lutea TaxID=272919 RepID=A0ABR9JFI7_9MICC|nr:amidase [Nesterenkonia lutea]MBE1524689.1 Asp-tRNA(Asn)/Glu-tRNA(Gln) amidotransferase A subunit family amidase [Nesterenkonia lutea]
METKDSTVWREGGDAHAPLVPAVGSGPLDGQSVAVKDLYAVAGHRIGAGNPTWLAEAAVETTTAAALAQLLQAGAEVLGIAQTDELALSLAGTNQHYGTPPNPRAADRISGGSSSGSAAAVALGEASIGLGTDTGGSIRVPASYQGLWGMRSTHGLISREGLLPLAQSFDTVGWMTRDAETLGLVADVLVPVRQEAEQHAGLPAELTLIPSLFDQVDPEVAETVRAAVDGVTAHQNSLRPRVHLKRLDGVSAEMRAAWLEAFRIIQMREAWANHGSWVGARWEAMADDVGARFRMASQLSADQERQARALAAGARRIIREWVGDSVLALPSAAGPAPLRSEAALGGKVIEEHRRGTMMLTCLAGLAGLPAVNVPLRTAAGLPTGVCLLGPVGSDRELVRWAQRFHARLPSTQETR